jgi:hypothetical protein
MGGHVAKKLGDGLMALFGYPLAHENDGVQSSYFSLKSTCSTAIKTAESHAKVSADTHSRVTRLRIRPINSRRPFQSQPSNVYRLILSESGACTATIQLALLNSICQKTADHLMMRCGGREAAHCAGFHQISPRCWWTRNRNGSSSVRRACIRSSQ